MSHQDRRHPLPKGYQFGDAGRGPTPSQVAYEASDASWLRVLADQFKQLDNGRWVLRYGTELFAWTPTRLRAVADKLENSISLPHLLEARNRWRPAYVNAAEQLKRRGEYSVIEGEHE